MLISFLKGKSIRFKLQLYFFSLIVLPIITMGIIGDAISSKAMEEEVNTHTVQMIGTITGNVEFTIRDMENVIYYLANDPRVERFLSGSNDLPQEQKEDVFKVLATFKSIHPEIAGIIVVSETNQYVSNEMKTISRDPLTEEVWYTRSVAQPDAVQLFSKPIGRNIMTSMNYSADDVVAVAKAVKDSRTGKCLGVILIDMKLEVIKKLIEDITLGKKGFLYIMDENGGIVYAPVNPIVYRVNYEWLGEQHGSTVKQIKDDRYQIIYKESGYTKWKTVGVFSLSETLGEVAKNRYYSLVIALITFTLSIIAAIFFTASIAKPLLALGKLMNRAEDGDLSVRFHSRYNDEIGRLGKSFNKMIGEISKLIDMVYEEQKSKREAELKTLQAQIKPHFLYNTLDTIQWMAQAHGMEDIVKMVNALAKLFRIALSRGKEVIKVREELEHVNSYLTIQTVRYEGKLDYEITFEEDILDCQVIKLILQPIVENAIYHGIHAKRGKGKIYIHACKEQEKLCFVVRDNGKGMTPEKAAEMAELLKANRQLEQSGYGMFNVHERIRLSFGSEYGLQFESTYEEGTVVRIIHPIMKE